MPWNVIDKSPSKNPRESLFTHFITYMNGIRQELERLYSELLNYNADNICPILQRCAGGQLWNRGRRVGGKQGGESVRFVITSPESIADAFLAFLDKFGCCRRSDDDVEKRATCDGGSSSIEMLKLSSTTTDRPAGINGRKVGKIVAGSIVVAVVAFILRFVMMMAREQAGSSFNSDTPKMAFRVPIRPRHNLPYIQTQARWNISPCWIDGRSTLYRRSLV